MKFRYGLATFLVAIPFGANSTVALAQACRLQRCTVSMDSYLQASAACTALWSSPDDNAVAMGCAAQKIAELPKTCRAVKYNCDDLAASILGIVPAQGDDGYVVSVRKLP